MGLFSLFRGKSPEQHESEGDALASEKEWGDAKMAFEAGLEKLSKRSSADPAMMDRLRDKLHQSKEALAMAHRSEALALMDADCMADARELLNLAADLTDDLQLKEDLAQMVRETFELDKPLLQPHDGVFQTLQDESQADLVHEDMDDHFNVLLGALPEDIQRAYLSYGDDFKQGYLALNSADFQQAVEYLTRAAEENPSPPSLVSLELATACVNLGQSAEAQSLLETLVRYRTDLLPAYQLLCELYWENKEFERAMQLLDALPKDQAQSMAAYQIRGETLLQARRFEEAISYFQNLLQTYGWKEPVALGLAKAHEALGQISEARDVYRELIGQCGSGCGTRIHPSIKRKYADLSLATGNYTSEVLEYYLELSREDSANAVYYYQNISRIYTELGNDAESRRFQSIAEELALQR